MGAQERQDRYPSTTRVIAPNPRHGGDEEGCGDEEGGRHEKGRHEGWSDEEGNEEGQGDRGGVRAKHRGLPLWIFCRARPRFFEAGVAGPPGPALLYITWLVSVACGSLAEGA